jgi:glycosyltransferase involved in cell wall biosynthesis
VFDFIVAVNDEQTLESNFARSPILRDEAMNVHFQRGYRCAAAAYNAGLDAATNEFVVFAHQDVYLPSSWREAMVAAIGNASLQDPAWAVLGLFGATPEGQHVGHVWSTGLNKLLGQQFMQPIAVHSIDELLIVVRRSSSIRFDDRLPGFHLYGTDIVQAALSSNRSAYAVCAPVIHNSRPILYLPSDYLLAYEYLRRKWSARLPIQNCISPIVEGRMQRLRNVMRHHIGKWRYGHIARSQLDRKLDCVAVAQQLGLDPLNSSVTAGAIDAT